MTSSGVVLHVLVVGFHHKKGCQVEYCYPALDDASASDTAFDVELPEPWKCLPSLAMPDGAHNVEKDTVLFLLPSVSEPGKTLYCVSCYRQINAEKLLSKGADVTRTTVQKSVVVICRLPLFGLMKTKLELITQAYFNELDFAKRDVLAEMYTDLCQSLQDSTAVRSQTLLGISCRATLRRFKHRVLTIFKLILLEKRILITAFPVYDLCNYILSILSLFPNMIEHGLDEATEFIDFPPPAEPTPPTRSSQQSSPSHSEHSLDAESGVVAGGIPNSVSIDSIKRTSADAYARMSSRLSGIWAQQQQADGNRGSESPVKTDDTSKKTIRGAIEIALEANEPSDFEDYVSNLHTDNWGFPLSIFVKGFVCYPYASLSYLDRLKSCNSRCYMIGATNALFKQRRNLFDAIVYFDDKNELCIDYTQPEVKRVCGLSTADLRLMDFMVREVQEDTGNIYMDNTTWEGGDEWIRLQFQSYLLSLLATSESDSPTNPISDFHEPFVQAWKTTRNYKIWTNGQYAELGNSVPGHPFAGQLSAADLRLRMEVGLSSSESGRKIQQTLGDTGKYVAATTGKFKSTFSNWWKQPSPTTPGEVTGPEIIEQPIEGVEDDNKLVDEEKQPVQP